MNSPSLEDALNLMTDSAGPGQVVQDAVRERDVEGRIDKWRMSRIAHKVHGGTGQTTRVRRINRLPDQLLGNIEAGDDRTISGNWNTAASTGAAKIQHLAAGADSGAPGL